MNARRYRACTIGKRGALEEGVRDPRMGYADLLFTRA
jgi:hypothetical protein